MEIKKVILYKMVFWATVSNVLTSSDPIQNAESNKEDFGRSTISKERSMQLFPGLHLIFKANEIGVRFAPEEIISDIVEEGKKKSDKKTGLAQYAPMLTMIPFLLQLLSLPGALASIKMSLLKSLLVGKLALGIIIFNALRNSQNTETVVVHQAYHEHHGHYHHEHHDEEEDAGWFGRRRRR